MTTIRYIDRDNPIHQIPPQLLALLRSAQDTLLAVEFKSARELTERILDDLRIRARAPQDLKDSPVQQITAQTHRQLCAFWVELLRGNGLPEQSIPNHAANLAQQTQLVEAFASPEAVLLTIDAKVKEVVAGFPRQASQIERGKNPGDVLDPYILAATQFLMCGGNFEQAIGHLVAHKAMMMIEGLLGHLHEDVIGMMRGNVRIPEPRGADQETLDPRSNPFPGADIVQPPWSQERGLRFHQVKSKTGSAKGGDGRRLGEQLQRLHDAYGGGIYYHALIGNTLRGHRSKAGVERAARDVVVLVGDASFEELTGSTRGPQLLLRVYQAGFTNVALTTGYRVDQMAAGIVATFQEKSSALSEGYLDDILKAATGGERNQQDNRLFGRTRSATR